MQRGGAGILLRRLKELCRKQAASQKQEQTHTKENSVRTTQEKRLQEKTNTHPYKHKKKTQEGGKKRKHKKTTYTAALPVKL